MQASDGIAQAQGQEEEDGEEGDMIAALQKAWENRFTKKPPDGGKQERPAKAGSPGARQDRPRKCPKC